MRRSRRYSKDDLAVWQQVRATVRPIAKKTTDKLLEHQEELSERLHPAHFSPSPIQSHRSQKGVKIDFKQTAPIASTKGMQRSTQRAVARGRIEPDGKIDLHGLRLEDARMRFFAFLRSSAANQHKVVLVVTGKGGHKRFSDFGHEVSGVIRRALPEWLAEMEARALVSHFCQAHITHGGEGAWYVFIRATARRSGK